MARQQVSRNEDFLKLAQARYQVGQATLLDVRQAEVTKGTSEVTLLRAIQTENEAKLELMRRMGVVAPVAIDQLRLTDSFPVVAPDFKLDELLAAAASITRSSRRCRPASRRRVPVYAVPSRIPADPFTQCRLERVHSAVHQRGSAARPGAQRRAGTVPELLDNNVIRHRPGSRLRPTAWRPPGWSSAGELQPEVADGIRSSNNVFPFSFSRQPFSARATISLPIFTGFSRHLRLAQAQAQRG